MENKQKGFSGKWKILNLENLLCLFIIICPILDAASFIFRNYFNTNFSISTFIRPIIPIIAVLYIFFKEKLKPQMLLIAGIYALYGLGHLYVFYRIKTGCAYGNEIRELQYLINYTYMIMNLFIYIYFFAAQNRLKEISNEEKGKAIYKLRKTVLICLTIYVGLIYLSLITKTSSYTYGEEKIGYKGWFESGNSLGTIILLTLFIVVPMISKKYLLGIRIWALMVTALAGAYITTLLGTRTGLYGFIIVILTYIVIAIIYGFIHSKNINKKAIALAIGAIRNNISWSCSFWFKNTRKKKKSRK